MEQDRSFEAERILRQIVAETSGGIEPYLQLARLAINQQNLDDAAAWLTIARGENRGEDEADTATLQSELFYHILLLSELSSGRSLAAEKAVDYLHRKNSDRTLIDSDVDILVFAAGYYIQQENYRKALELLSYYKKVFSLGRGGRSTDPHR